MPIHAFHDVRFPTDIAIGSSGGPETNTQIVTLGSGQEHRNQRWARSRRRYEAGYGIKDLDTLHEVVAFFEARRGPLHAFRYRDPLDWKSCAPLKQVSMLDQTIGTGDGNQTGFALIKTYGQDEAAYERAIEKPVIESVVVAVDGVANTAFSIDGSTGEVIFQSAPAAGAEITAGYEFDVPVRFAQDQLTVSLAAFRAGDVPSVQLLEVKL